MKAEVGAMIYTTISQKLRNKTPVPMFYRGNKSRVRQCVKLCVTIVFQLISNSNTHKHLRNFYTPGFHITQHNITRTMLACFTCKLLPDVSLMFIFINIYNRTRLGCRMCVQRFLSKHTGCFISTFASQLLCR